MPRSDKGKGGFLGRMRGVSPDATRVSLPSVETLYAIDRSPLSEKERKRLRLLVLAKNLKATFNEVSYPAARRANVFGNRVQVNSLYGERPEHMGIIAELLAGGQKRKERTALTDSLKVSGEEFAQGRETWFKRGGPFQADGGWW